MAGIAAGSVLGHSLPQPGHSKDCVVVGAGTTLGGLGGKMGRNYSAL